MAGNFGGFGRGFLDNKAGKKKEVPAKKDTSSTSRASSTETKGAEGSSEGWQGYTSGSDTRPRLEHSFEEAKRTNKVLKDNFINIYNNLLQAGMQKEAHEMHKIRDVFKAPDSSQDKEFFAQMKEKFSGLPVTNIRMQLRRDNIEIANNTLAAYIEKGKALLNDQTTH